MSNADQRSSIEKSIEKTNRLTETKLTHNLKIFNTPYPYRKKVFANVQHKLSRPYGPDAGTQGQRDDLGNVHVSDNEGISSSRFGLQ